MGKITDYRRKFFTSEDRPGALGYGRPAVIVELFETLNGPNVGTNATVHRFSHMPGSQENEVLYCFEDTTSIPVRDICEHCTVSSAPDEGDAPHPPTSGPRYNCSYAIDMRHCFWQEFDWESHREQALGRWDQGLSSGDMWNVVKKRPGDRFAPDPPKATLGTRKREEVDPKRLDAELWLEGLSKGSEATGSLSKKSKPRSISLEATVDIATPAPGTHRYDPAFTDPEATVVLTSADGLSYRLHLFVLRTSSKIPLVDANLGESSEVLGRLFRIIGGLGAGKWETLDDVERVLSAACKYKMPGPISDIRGNVLASFIAEQPLQVFFIAAYYEWEQEAKLASTHTLSLCMDDEKYVAMLDRNPSTHLSRLLRLHRVRRDKFKAHIARDDRCFGIEVCPCCRGAHNQDSAPALRNLMNAMVWEMDRQPAGLELLSGRWKEWPAYQDGQLCPKIPESNLQEVIYGQRIMEDVRACIESLPLTI